MKLGGMTQLAWFSYFLKEFLATQSRSYKVNGGLGRESSLVVLRAAQHNSKGAKDSKLLGKALCPAGQGSK